MQEEVKAVPADVLAKKFMALSLMNADEYKEFMKVDSISTRDMLDFCDYLGMNVSRARFSSSDMDQVQGLQKCFEQTKFEGRLHFVGSSNEKQAYLHYFTIRAAIEFVNPCVELANGRVMGRLLKDCIKEFQAESVLRDLGVSPKHFAYKWLPEYKKSSQVRNQAAVYAAD